MPALVGDGSGDPIHPLFYAAAGDGGNPEDWYVAVHDTQEPDAYIQIEREMRQKIRFGENRDHAMDSMPMHGRLRTAACGL